MENLMRFLSTLCLSVFLVGASHSIARAAEEDSPKSTWTGLWHTTSRDVSFVVYLDAEGTGAFLMIHGGAISLDPITWTTMPEGILVNSRPRLRFWKGRTADQVRVEMEPVPPEATSRRLSQFPLAFWMRRVAMPQPQRDDRRPLPQGWDQPQVPKDWDQRAGQWRDVAAEEPAGESGEG